MSSPSLRVTTHQRFADELSRELAGAHQLQTFSGESDAAMADLLAKTDVLVWGAYKAAWNHPRGSALRLVHSTGAGTDGIDFQALPQGCTVCNVYGHQWGVAEHAFLLLMALHKDLAGLDRSLRQGDWTPNRAYLPEMRGRSLLILGFGHIGEELVRWGRFFGMKITVLTRTPAKVRADTTGLTIGALSELGKHLPDADFVVVAIPAAPGTVDLFGAREFAQMKSSAFIVNVGRGPVLNEDALYEALKTRRIAGAGLDVWYLYGTHGQTIRPSRQPFHELDNVIMTPHKPTIETMSYRWKEIAANVNRFSRGEALRCLVSPP